MNTMRNVTKIIPPTIGLRNVTKFVQLVIRNALNIEYLLLPNRK